MNSYLILIFLHVASAMVLFTAWGIEAITLRWLHESLTVNEAQTFVKRLRKQKFTAPLAMLTVLGTGIWMMAVRWGDQWWMIVAFIALVLIIVIGVVTLRRVMPRLRGLLAENPEQLPADFIALTGHLVASIRMRMAIGFGIIGLMTIKPGIEGTLIIMAIAVGIGFFTIHSLRRKSVSPLTFQE